MKETPLKIVERNPAAERFVDINTAALAAIKKKTCGFLELWMKYNKSHPQLACKNQAVLRPATTLLYNEPLPATWQCAGNA